MLRRCVALGTDWRWLHHTHMTLVGADTWHIWPARSSRQPGHGYLLQTELAPRTPMGVATVSVFCIWTECSRFDRCSYFQSHSLKLFRTDWTRANWSGNLDWGAARSAAADTAPERRRQQQQQKRRHGCDAKAGQKKQRFKSRKGNLSFFCAALFCSFSFAF